MENNTQIAQVIIDTINTIFENILSSIDNNLYTILDNITFISSDILKDKNFENLLGTSTSNGILLISNSLLIGFIISYAISYLMSHIIYNKIEKPFSFIMKMIIFGICMNSSFFIMQLFLDLNYNISGAIKILGENLFHHSISFSELINKINSNMTISTNSINVFSLDGLIKGALSFSLLSLVASYSLRYIMIKLFVLLTPFAFLSQILSSTSWFFRAWAKNLFSLLFIQIIVSLILLILFSLDFSSSNLLNKFIYIGGIYALIRANSFVREFIGGISTNVSQSVHNLTGFKI